MALTAVGMEVILTSFLVLVVLKVTVRQGHALGGLIVGLTIVTDILAGGPILGAALAATARVLWRLPTQPVAPAPEGHLA